MLCVIPEILGGKLELSPEEMQMIKNLHDACVEQSGVSDNAIAEVNKKNYAYIETDHNLKLDDDGVFDHEAYLDLMPDTMKNFAQRVNDHCEDKIKDVHAGDICETGYKIQSCMIEANPDLSQFSAGCLNLRLDVSFFVQLSQFLAGCLKFQHDVLFFVQLSQFLAGCLIFQPTVSIFGWMFHFSSSCLNFWLDMSQLSAGCLNFRLDVSTFG
ncbi:hypothetical protein V9T40_000554 [Parthenolecanium corni]|uniref:Uncharacterized protein n=1 Tax=Parthenolecanium corni TaxID=536013 RepID=A0AAN9Y1Q9_9HEMI